MLDGRTAPVRVIQNFHVEDEGVGRLTHGCGEPLPRRLVGEIRADNLRAFCCRDGLHDVVRSSGLTYHHVWPCSFYLIRLPERHFYTKPNPCKSYPLLRVHTSPPRPSVVLLRKDQS